MAFEEKQKHSDSQSIFKFYSRKDEYSNALLKKKWKEKKKESFVEDRNDIEVFYKLNIRTGSRVNRLKLCSCRQYLLSLSHGCNEVASIEKDAL